MRATPEQLHILQNRRDDQDLIKVLEERLAGYKGKLVTMVDTQHFHTLQGRAQECTELLDHILNRKAPAQVLPTHPRSRA